MLTTREFRKSKTLYTNNDQFEEVLKLQASVYNRNKRGKFLRINVTRLDKIYKFKLTWKTQKKTLANRTYALFLDRKPQGINVNSPQVGLYF